MKKLILSLTLIALLTASLGGAAFAQSQQEPLPEVTTETAQGSAPAQADASQSMYPAVHALVEGKGNRIIASRDGRIVDLDMEEALAMSKQFQMDRYAVLEALTNSGK